MSDPAWMVQAKRLDKAQKERDKARAEFHAAQGERIVDLERKIKATVEWLETNQPDVFGRGLWDAIQG